MKVALLTYGTRGDVQPYVVLGHALRERGHEVSFAVCTNLVDMVERAGLPAFEIPIDSQEFFVTREGRAILAAGKTTKFLNELGRRETEHRDALGRALIEASRGADVVVSSVLTTTRATSIVEQSGQRLLLVYTLPIEPTGDYPSPYLVPGHDVPTRAARRLTHTVFERVYWRGARANVAAFRDQLGLGSTAGNVFMEGRRRATPTMHLVSRELLAEPADWPAHLRNVGAPTTPTALRDAWGESEPSTAVDTWLDAGSPPVYFGFGSMPVLDPAATLAMIGDVARRLGVRALVGAGWSQLAPGAARNGGVRNGDVFVVDRFDHDRVLPRCRAAVHHGGAGTTHTALRAGLPAVVAHVFADQSLWGRQVTKLGLGATLPYRSLDADRLTAALRPLLDPDVKRRVEAAARRTREEDPVEAIAGAIESGVAAR